MELTPFEPVKLTDDDLRAFGMSEEEIKSLRKAEVEHPEWFKWTEEDKIFARKIQLILQEHLG